MSLKYIGTPSTKNSHSGDTKHQSRTVENNFLLTENEMNKGPVLKSDIGQNRPDKFRSMKFKAWQIQKTIRFCQA